MAYAFSGALQRYSPSPGQFLHSSFGKVLLWKRSLYPVELGVFYLLSPSRVSIPPIKISAKALSVVVERLYSDSVHATDKLDG